MMSFRESSWLTPTYPDTAVERHRFVVPAGDDVVGRPAAVRVAQGDALPDLARHFGLGVNAVSAANPGVDVWVPEAGRRIILPLSFVLPDAPREGIVVNLATMRLFHYQRKGKELVVSTYPVGVGTAERPTPMGRMHVARKAVRPTWHVPASIAEDHRKKGAPLPPRVPPGPDNPLGEYALYLSAPSYLIHGTNKPASIGLNATNGCLRLYPENIRTLFDETPVKTPVTIVNQPYLVGQRDGVLYLEAHKPQDGSGAAELERLRTRLGEIEKRLARPLDWNRIREVQAEARGTPVAIFEPVPGSAQALAAPLDVTHPGTLLGRPELPELTLAGWYVLATEMDDAVAARRIAAIINHQGPPIPARVLAEGRRHRVIAGPFADDGAARAALKRLKIDLGMDGILIEPVSAAVAQADSTERR